MANTNTNVTPQLLAQGLMALRQNAVFARLVNRGYETLAAQRGAVVNIPIPSAITAREITAAVTHATNVDSSPTVAVVTLDQWYEAPFQLSDKDQLDVMNGWVPMQASEAVKALVNQIDGHIFGKHTGIYYYGGTAGTTPFATNVNLAGGARKQLNDGLAPMDNRRVVFDPAAENNFLILSNILDADKRGDQGGIIRGSIGHKLGMDFYMNQNVTSYTPGTGWVTGWALSTVSGLAGETTLNILNATASGTIKVGDLFTAAGSTQTYRVAAAATASATVAVVITIDPALVTSVATSGALTVIATAHIPNLVFHRDAFAFASRPLADSAPMPGVQMQTAVDPVSGIAMRLELSRQYKQTTFSYDALWGSGLVRGALAAKILG
jgi:hypothetical protein